MKIGHQAQNKCYHCTKTLINITIKNNKIKVLLIYNCLYLVFIVH